MLRSENEQGVADFTAAAAAKLLKDLHEQKQIEGRQAGECISCSPRIW